MKRNTVIAILCFVVGGLLGYLISYQFGQCKGREVVFKVQTPGAP